MIAQLTIEGALLPLDLNRPGFPDGWQRLTHLQRIVCIRMREHGEPVDAGLVGRWIREHNILNAGGTLPEDWRDPLRAESEIIGTWERDLGTRHLYRLKRRGIVSYAFGVWWFKS